MDGLCQPALPRASEHGFSYPLPADPSSVDPNEAFSWNDYNPFIDAAQNNRAVLRFLDGHPRLRKSEVILSGESYGSIRATVMLYQMLHPEKLEEEGSIYLDKALSKEIISHFSAAFPEEIVRFPRDEKSGHMVSMKQPKELGDDIEAWLEEK